MTSRKKLIILTLSLAILAFISAILLKILPDNSKNLNHDITLPDEVFYEADFDVDIMSDPDYLDLNRIISYTNGAITYTVSDDNYFSDEILEFIVKFTETIINGNAEAYANFFSEKYKSKYTLPSDFSMQRLYDIKIEKISAEAPNYIYMLEYKIHKNDGTLRRDIDSDAARPQYLVISEENSGLLINEIITYIQQ